MIDLLRLVRLVRLRRTLRTVARLTPIALVAWFLVLIIGLASTAEDSSTHVWFDDHGNRGFLIILAVLALDLVLIAGLSLAGSTGRAAARLVPMLRRLPDPVELTRAQPPAPTRAGKAVTEVKYLDLGTGGPAHNRGGDARAGTVGLTVVLLVLVIIGAVSGGRAPSLYRGSHGDGVTTVTFGQDSQVTRVVTRPRSSVNRPPAKDYYISTPDGEALAPGDTQPKDGTRFAIVSTPTGLQAVQLGGHSWVTALVIALLALALAVLTLIALIRRYARATRDPAVVPLASTLSELAAGKYRAVYPIPPTRPDRAGPILALTSPKLDDRSAEDVVSAHDRIDQTLIAALLVVLAVPAVVVALS